MSSATRHTTASCTSLSGMDACSNLHLLRHCTAEVEGGTAANLRVAEDGAVETVTARTLGGEAEDNIKPIKNPTNSSSTKAHSRGGTKDISKDGAKVRRPIRGDLVTPELYHQPPE